MESPETGPPEANQGPIQNEELASGVLVSGPSSPCSWHESIPQWVVVAVNQPTTA